MRLFPLFGVLVYTGTTVSHCPDSVIHTWPNSEHLLCDHETTDLGVAHCRKLEHLDLDFYRFVSRTHHSARSRGFAHPLLPRAS